MKHIVRHLPLVGVTVLSACALPPGAGPLELDTAPQWLSARNQKADVSSPAIEFKAQQWWREVNDPALTMLIEVALKDSAGAKAAAAKARAAAAQLGVLDADRYPQLGVRGEFSRQELSKNYYVPPQFGGIPLNIGQLTLNAQWNLDLWGQQRKAIEAAMGQVKAAAAEQAMVALQLSTQIAKAYVPLRATKVQLQALSETVALREEQAALQASRQSLGLDNGTGLDQARDALSQTRLLLEQGQGQQNRLLAALDALVGDPSVTQAAVQSLDASLPPPMLHYRSNQPIALSLLTRRPDLLGERFRVESAAAQIDVARLTLLPNVNLNAYLGTLAIGFEKLTQGNSKVALLGSVVQLPIFDAGKIRFATEVKRAEFDALKARYESSVSNAAQEVINEVLLMEQYDKELEAQSVRLTALESQLNRARQRQQLGIDSRLPSLELDVAARYQRLRVLELQVKQLGNQIDLVQALGGGFDASSMESKGQNL